MIETIFARPDLIFVIKGASVKKLGEVQFAEIAWISGPRHRATLSHPA
jgi:hypothetical protein